MGEEVMAKTNQKQIYEDEKKIITELKKDSRGSIDDIAKKCGFSRQKIWRIMKRLEDNKTVWGYTVIVDDEKFETKKFIMLIKRSVGPIHDAINKIVNLTMQRKGSEIGVNIEYSLYTHGDYDWIFIFTAKDIKYVNKFSNILISEYSNIISDIKILEGIFPVQISTIVNPNVGKLKDII